MNVNRRRAITAASLLLVVCSAVALVDDPLNRRTMILAGVCVVLWLSELVPPFTPTLILLVGVPIVLGSYHPQFHFRGVMTWLAEPVLALFAGGFALGLAAQRHGLDVHITQLAIRISGRRRRRLIASVAVSTAILSMWISNIAAAAMMLAAIRPILSTLESSDPFRRSLLLALALGANFGGMTTPVGSGPNGIAIAAVAPGTTITFLHWMLFALPLAASMIGVGILLLVRRYRIEGQFELVVEPGRLLRGSSLAVLFVFALTILAWLTEPFHELSAAVVALLAATILFSSGLLQGSDVRNLDWATLGLVGGGIALGKLVEVSGLFDRLATSLPIQSGSVAWTLALVFASAGMSALMSNTGTAALLIPFAMSLTPSPQLAILIALGSSFGIPFAVSTPPNAMAYGEGGLTSSDLLFVGLPLMILGCITIALTGGTILRFLGVN